MLTAIRGFMSASAMPLGSVTPWKVDQGPLYHHEKQGDSWGPHEEETGGLSSESNSAVRRFSPPPLHFAPPLSFQLCSLLSFSAGH